ncbi:hypothetical protein LR48_Vigan11g072800 [Vigna angularis]|uniref:Uncharacterized protein n=1 Tax=Phaseolus angularis TaxID=3914 RepID=A0A0L9VRJ4_PHAAN|nr:hypothetical protein LR48_Vigan11g072800 [Vigna angularis]
MTIIDVTSSLELLGRGDGGAADNGGRSSSPDSVSSSYLERSDGDGDSRPLSPGGINIDDVGPVPVDGLSIVRGDDWVSHDSTVLRELNVAASQLHLNAWASVQAFVAMCYALGITPTVPILLHYFDVRPLAKQGC